MLHHTEPRGGGAAQLSSLAETMHHTLAPEPQLRTVVRGTWCAAIALGWLLAGCASPGEPRYLLLDRPGEVIRVACVGDSITMGHGLADPASHAYPVVLARRMGEGVSVTNMGISGITVTGYPLRDLDALAAWRPHIVVVKLGTNDARRDPEAGGEAFSARYRQVIKILQGTGRQPAVFVCDPVWSPDPAVEDVLERRVRPAVHRVARSTGAELIDTYGPFVGHSEWYADTLHPNETGMRILADLVYERVAPLLEQQRVVTGWGRMGSYFRRVYNSGRLY